MVFVDVTQVQARFGSESWGVSLQKKAIRIFYALPLQYRIESKCGSR